MSIKRFNPRIDNIIFPHDWYLKGPDNDQKNIILNEALSEALYYLRQNYTGAVETYEIHNWLKGWLEIGLPEDFLINRGLLCAVLDYYYTRNTSPKKKIKLSDKRFLKFCAYIEGRILECLMINAAKQLIALAISKFMPDSWIGESAISESIKKEILSIGSYEKPEIEFDLMVHKSGNNWLYDNSISEWNKLKVHLDNCEPQIIVYMPRTDSHCYLEKTAIAYDYVVINQNNVEVCIYNPADNGKADKIRIQVGQDNNKGLFHNRIEGFYIIDYKPSPVPNPLWFRLVRFVFPWTVVWYLKRWLYFIRHRDIKDSTPAGITISRQT